MRFDKSTHDHAWEVIDAVTAPDLAPLGRPHNGLAEILGSIPFDKTAEYLLMEIGSELGGSTRFLLDYFPNASIVCIDPWPEGYKVPAEFEALKAHVRTEDSLYEFFLHFCRSYRDRILPIREFSSEGVIRALNMGLTPDIVYVDGDHRYLGTLNDLILVHNLFPEAWIIGDDWNFSSRYPVYKGIEKSVQRAAVDFADHFGLPIRNFANTYVIEPGMERQRSALNYTVSQPKKN